MEPYSPIGTRFPSIVFPARYSSSRPILQTQALSRLACDGSLPLGVLARGVAHAQGTMDFSGAQTLMGTFKTFAAYVRRADDGTLSRLVVESSILLAAPRGNATTVLKEAATAYKVDTDAIAAKVKQ